MAAPPTTTRKARTVSGSTLLESPPGRGLDTVVARVASLLREVVSVPRALTPVSVTAAGLGVDVGGGLGVAVGGMLTFPGSTA
jgi:hypothetical protein